jgi:NadR type nicotinamide-nucleotide adenylyltransferase
MFRVGIVGPESTGKSTLAAYLAARHNAVWVPEYAREYMERLSPDHQYTYDDVIAIAHHQIQQLVELNAVESECVFFDTELLITKVWLEHKYGHCPDFIIKALHQYPMDVYLLCVPDLPWEPDPVRENPHLREYLFEWYEREIQAMNIPYYIIRHQ